MSLFSFGLASLAASVCLPRLVANLGVFVANLVIYCTLVVALVSLVLVVFARN